MRHLPAIIIASIIGFAIVISTLALIEGAKEIAIAAMQDLRANPPVVHYKEIR